MDQPTRESFLKNVKDHQIKILKDDRVYRHIKCNKPGTWNMGFEIITFPNGLLFTGDMGTYEFERTNDMFSFFRSGIDEEGDININPYYWSEKCLAESVFGQGIEKFDSELFIENVTDYFNSYFEDNNSEEKQLVWEEIENQILNGEEYEWELISALNNFTTYGIDTKFDFTDFWEDPYESKTYHFIWCLYAIVWTIKEYDKLKGEIE